MNRKNRLFFYLSRRAQVSIFLVVFLLGCSTTKKNNQYIQLDVKEFQRKKTTLKNKDIALKGYVLGSVLSGSAKGNNAQSLFITLGEKAQLNDEKGNQLVFADHSVKFRAIEDGYNYDILLKCNLILQQARAEGQMITLFGKYNPDIQYKQYMNGFDLYINKIKVGNTMIDTDYNDSSKFAKKTPGLLKGIYKGVKKILKVFGKAF